METRAPTVGRVAVAIGFALSCFGLLLFLWIAFGGPVPLGSQSYRVTVPFDEATQLAQESDVRISGVSVGKVKSIELSDSGLADATIEIDPQYAPIPVDTRAILRQKTLLGETYVELTPGSSDGETVPEGGALAEANVADSVQLDEIFRAFDEPTRAAFQTWMADAAVAFKGRGADLNAALGNLTPFAERADDLLRVLDSQRLAVRQLIRDGGATFEALSERPGELRSLIENTESVFQTTADRDAQLREIFQILPTFLDESDKTLTRLETFAVDTDPLVTQLRPSARELSGTFIQLRDLSPVLVKFFDGLRPVIDRSRAGFGALRQVLDDQLPPPLARVDAYFDELIPIIDTVQRYRRETTAFLANTAAALNGFGLDPVTGSQVKYLRTTSPLGPEVLASLPNRLKVSRTNAYVKPGGYTELSQGLESFLTAQCTGGLSVTLNGPGDLPDDLYQRVQEFAFGGTGNTDSDNIPTPRCVQQPQQPSIGGPPDEETYYPHVHAEP